MYLGLVSHIPLCIYYLDDRLLGSHADTPVQHLASLPTDIHVFQPVSHPMGTLCMSTTYLTAPKFEIFDRESLLSSRFLSQDEGPEFTPTLLKNQQRDSLSGSPSSLPARTSLPRSPPGSIADRFVVPPPAHHRTTSLSGGSPRPQNVALPMTRATSASGVGTTVSASIASDTSSRQGGASVGSREEPLPVSALAARLRKESFGLGRGTGTVSVLQYSLLQILMQLDRIPHLLLELCLFVGRHSTPCIHLNHPLCLLVLLPYTRLHL